MHILESVVCWVRRRRKLPSETGLSPSASKCEAFGTRARTEEYKDLLSYRGLSPPHIIPF